MRRLALPILAAVVLSGCGLSGITGGDAATTAVPSPPEATATVPTLIPGKDGCDHTAPPATTSRPTFAEAPPSPLVGTGSWTVTMTTSCGPLVIELDPTVGGDATAAFAALVRAGFYNGLSFHRVVPGFVIQGGDPLGTGAGGPGFTVESAPPSTYKYRNGDVAMAKAGSEPAGTAGSQFFIVSTESGAAMLDPLYAVVGHVLDASSTETIRTIDRLGVSDGPPVEPAWIWTARLTEKK